MFRNVALLGAASKIGPAIHKALLDIGCSVTVLSRESSSSKYPENVPHCYYSEEARVDELSEILTSIKADAVITAIAGSHSEIQIRFADACAKAGVRTFIPADFGSCDCTSARALELPVYRAKLKVLQHLQKLATTSSLSWTSLVCGHFFDWGLESGLLFFNVKDSKATIFDGGNIKWSATTIDTIGLATARIIQNEESTRNQMLFVQSFCVTQNEVLRSLEKATGKDWLVEHIDSKSFIENTKKEIDANPVDHDTLERLVGVLGIVDSNWEHNPTFSNSDLGIVEENLDAVIAQILQA